MQSIQHADYVVPVEIEYHWHNVYVIKRPGVDNFLKKMGEIYEVVVFTASLSKVRLEGGICSPDMNFSWLCSQYADPVLDKLDVHRVVSHRLFRESCYNHRGNYVKVILFLFTNLFFRALAHPCSSGSLTVGAPYCRHHHHRQLACIIHFPPQ